MDSETLYHGSPNKLIGIKLRPKQATDIENNPENIKKAVYATDKKELAITMAIISSKGVRGSSLDFKKQTPPYGTIYHGKPIVKLFYLYELDSNNFKKSKVNNQFFSENSIKPLKIETLKIEDYVTYFKYANSKEKKEWDKKIKQKTK